MSDEPQPAAGIEPLATRLARLSKFAGDLNVQAGRMSDHLFGPAPRSGPVNRAADQPHGIIGHMRDDADDIEQSLIGLGRLLVALAVHIAPLDPGKQQPIEAIDPPAPVVNPLPEPAPTWQPPRPVSAVAALTGQAG